MLKLIYLLDATQDAFEFCSLTDTQELLAIIHKVFIAIMIVVPLVLLFVGLFDLAKAATSKDENEVKKAQQALIKKAVAGALVFLVPFIIGVLMSVLNHSEYQECFDTVVHGKQTGQDIKK